MIRAQHIESGNVLELSPDTICLLVPVDLCGARPRATEMLGCRFSADGSVGTGKACKPTRLSALQIGDEAWILSEYDLSLAQAKHDHVRVVGVRP
jgi:hypothetical protein